MDQNIRYWILPSNSKRFRMEESLRANNGMLDWRCKGMKVGDIVFMYKTMPEGCIKYMMVVTKANFGKNEALDQDRFWIDMVKFNSGKGIYSRLKLLEVLDAKRLSINVLRSHGIKGNIQTKRSCPKETLKFILDTI